MRTRGLGIAILGAAVLQSCGAGQAVSTPIQYTYQVVNVFPHDREAFTQGLFYLDGTLYEGTGLNGRSSIRKVKLETGEVLERFPLTDQYFGEGIAPWKDRLFELTWQNNTAFVFDRGSFQLKQTFPYKGEGWGLTADNDHLIMSDGTAELRFLDPETFVEKRRVRVMDGETPIPNLNELEFIKGEVWANVWQTERIVRIDPSSGRVTGWIDLPGLLKGDDLQVPVDVFNGIAFDAGNDRIFVTGKLWPKLFEIKVMPASASAAPR